MEEQGKHIDTAEQDLQKRGRDLRNAEKALRKQRKDQETAVERRLASQLKYTGYSASLFRQNLHSEGVLLPLNVDEQL